MAGMALPAECAAFLAARKPVFPDPDVLAKTQDRLIEKGFIAGLGIAVAPFAPVGSDAELAAAVATVGVPAVCGLTVLLVNPICP